jgi:hypothetical protein
MYVLELIETGEEFELLCEDLLRAKGLDVPSRPSRGPDGGADMIVGRERWGRKLRWAIVNE